MLCPNCKKEIENGSAFCEHCGARVKKSKKGLWIMLSVIFMAAVVTIVVITVQEQQAMERNRVEQHQRKVEQQLQAEREARQEAERQAEAQRKAKEEAERQAELARQEAARNAELARQEATRKAEARKAEAERQAELARQEAARKAEQEQKCYIDLGLPSGTKWKNANEDHNNKYTYDQAISKYGQRMPTKWQCEELVNKCKWSWTGSGMRVTGPNGNSIFFPVEDLLVVWMSDYWSSTRKEGKGNNAYALKITDKDGVGVGFYYTEVERFVRLVK